jgi:cellulose synthase operon protein C
MARQYINWKLVIILIVATGVFGSAAFLLHEWQKSTKAERALPQGEQAYAEGSWEQAADYFGTYLNTYGDRVPIWMKYADSHLKIRPLKTVNLGHAFAAYSTVLRLDKGNDDATDRMVRLCLRPEWWRPIDANQRVVDYLAIKKDSPALRRFRGIALIGQRKFTEGAAVLVQLINDHPDEVPAYEVMGQLAEKRREDVNLPAINWVDEAVKRNPTSALAYAIRASSRLVKDRDPNAAKADLSKALTLDLSDTTVRLRVIRELLNAGLLDKARENLDILQAKLPKDEVVWQETVEFPKDVLVWQYLAEWAMRSGSVEEMQRVAKTGQEELSRNSWDFLPTAASLYISAGQLEEAERCVARMREKNISPPDVAFLQGLLYQKRGLPSKTVASWEEAIALRYRGSSQLRVDLANILMQMGDLQSAAEQFRILIIENPENVRARQSLISVLVQARDWPGVREQCGMVRQLDPRNGEVVLMDLQAQIQMLAAGGESAVDDDAWRTIEKQLARLDEENKGSARVKLLRAQAAVLQTKLAEAAALLDELQKGGFSELAVNLLRSQLLVAQKKESEAIALLQKTIVKFPQEYEPVRNLATLLRQLGKQQECEELVKTKIEGATEPSIHRRFMLLMCDLYGSWGKADQAEVLLTGLAKQGPEDIQVRRRLLTLDRIARDAAESQKLVDQIKAIEGEKGWQWRYEQARVWFVSKEFESHYPEIVKLLKANLQAQPANYASRLLLAMAYEKHGELQLAVTAYQEVWDRAPDDMSVIVRLVAALNKTGNAAKAQDILERVGDRRASIPILQRLEYESKKQLGEWDSASKVLEQLAADDPNDVAVNLTLASIFVRQKRCDDAQGILDRLRAKASKSTDFVDIQARLYIEQGNAEAAVKMCNEAVQTRGDASAYRLRARIYSLLNQPVKAIDDIQKALVRDPNDLPTVQLAASLFIGSGNRTLQARAREMLDRASAAHPGDLDLKYSRARLLLLRNTAQDVAEARQLFTEVTKGRPRAPEAWEQLGWMELRDGQPGRAIEISLDGLRSNPRDKRLLLLKAQAEAARSPIQAVPTLTSLLEQDPNDSDVMLLLADIYVRGDQAGKAVELLQQRVGKLGGIARRRCEIALASSLYRNGQAEPAAKQFVSLIQAEPNDPSPVLTFARLLSTDKRWTELRQLTSDWTTSHPRDIGVATTVAEWLSQSQGGPEAKDLAEVLLKLAIERNPKHDYGLYLLAVLLQNKGQNAEAIRLNRQALAIDSNNIIVMNNLAWLLCENGDPKQVAEALELARKGYKASPDYCDLIDTLGVVHYRMGNYKEAADVFADCLKKSPSGRPLVVQTRFHLGQTYEKMGRKTEAAKELSEALKGQETLDQQNRAGGMSPEDRVEAKRLLDQLQKGSPV